VRFNFFEHSSVQQPRKRSFALSAEEVGVAKLAAVRLKYSSEACKRVVLTSPGDETPFNVACSLGHLDVVKALDNAGARRRVDSALGFSALHFAASSDATAVVDYLLSKPDADKEYAAFESNTALHLACATGSSKTVEVAHPQNHN
jgi:ankyrin repeat protein